KHWEIELPLLLVLNDYNSNQLCLRKEVVQSISLNSYTGLEFKIVHCTLPFPKLITFFQGAKLKEFKEFREFIP
ncbi:MAG: hypothetical protein IKK05_03490, partial [Alistipes sp.]|nr:hypothetical protein [Alistipes sp.]